MNLNNLLPGLAFIFLLLLMLLYWLQAAFFGKERYRSLNNFMSLLSLTSLTLLLTLRWIESRHFPLSNLYESLLFLSWCFLSLKILFTFDTKNTTNGSPKLSKRDTYMQTFALQPFDMALPKFSYLPYLSYLSDLSLRGDARDAMHVRAFTGGDAKRKRGDARDAEPLEEIKVEQDSSLGLGVVLSPLALLTFGFAFLSLPKEMQKATTLVPALQSNWLMMHVTVMLLSYAALLSGSVLSIVFLILSSLEDTKNRWAQDFAKGITSPKVMPSAKGEVSAPAPNPISNRKDPPVSNRKEARRMNTASSLTDKLDNYSYRVLALGFPLLTIGILSGAVWANEAWGSYWSWDPKETWALITWLVFAIYLHMRITRGWSGKKSAVVASAGFFVVWFCYLGVNLLGSGLHSYGWFSK